MKNENKALHGAKEAASYENIETSEEEKVLAFKREKDGTELIYIANMNDEKTSFSIQLNGSFEDYLSGETIEISEDKNIDLEPWQYFILINN